MEALQLQYESEGKSYTEVEIFAEVLGMKAGYVQGLGHSVRYGADDVRASADDGGAATEERQRADADDGRAATKKDEEHRKMMEEQQRTLVEQQERRMQLMAEQMREQLVEQDQIAAISFDTQTKIWVNYKEIPAPSRGISQCVQLLANLKLAFDAGGAESDDAELSDSTLMALNYLERVDRRKDGKKIEI
ncbi:hypothetical protein CJ030_MR5G001874 [Morella rubra]|uniref:Uncharacterized protein n=1 Tax=Morella rubra TaxID=262757 RepID=A0A6A1VJ63_9ROSI|nr:hypothetical protein CJ030_MR5G001874 [Morella rubra]